MFHLSLDFLWLVFLRLAVASPSPAPALQRRFRGECRVSVPPPGVGAPVPTAPGLAKLRFMGRPLWKTAHKRRPSPSIRSALVQWVCPPLVFGSSMISEHEVSSPRPRPTQRYCGSTERNGPPPPLNRLFSSVLPGPEAGVPNKPNLASGDATSRPVPTRRAAALPHGGFRTNKANWPAGGTEETPCGVTTNTSQGAKQSQLGRSLKCEV